MRRLNSLDWLTLILVLVGALNWGLVGLFDFNLVSSLFGEQTWASRTIYALVGISAVYVTLMSPSFVKQSVEMQRTA